MRDTSAGPSVARQRPREREHAVDAMAHGDSLLFRLDVNVARAARDAGGEQLVDERAHGRRGVVARHRRRGLGFAVEMLDLDGRFRLRGASSRRR